jgi:hypothetical protein
LKSKTFVLGIALLTVIAACSTQKKITAQYIGQRYTSTQNKSFVNNELLLLKGKDTIHMNVKLPYNLAESDTINNGILYRCFLKTNKLYTIKLKPICPADIPDVVNSYYKINTIPSKKNCSTFTEIKMDTEFLQRNPGKYVDINNRVYELTGLWPDTDCAFE